MSSPKLSDAAKDDLRDIWHAIATRRDERTADSVTAKILARCRSRAGFPESGRSRDELAPRLRSFLVAPYVVFYRPDEDTIQVIRIVHGHRDLRRLFADDGP